MSVSAAHFKDTRRLEPLPTCREVGLRGGIHRPVLGDVNPRGPNPAGNRLVGAYIECRFGGKRESGLQGCLLLRDCACLDRRVVGELSTDVFIRRLGNVAAARAIVMLQKTQRPVQFEITEQTRETLLAWIRAVHGAISRILHDGLACDAAEARTAFALAAVIVC